jgi:putative FmdB family regulatory protein
MPLYEYQCEKCGESFEVMQKFSDEPLSTHAKCGGPVHRLISAPALQFKGSGWYITDYAKGSGSSGNGSAKSGESSESKGSSSDSGSTAASSSSSEKKSSSSDTK